MSPRKIVVGVDDSPGSQHALRWAADEAVRTGRELVIINAHDWHVVGARFQVAGAYADALRQASEVVVAKAVDAVTSLAPDVRVTGETVVGSPGRALADAGDPDDLIVVGSRGHGGFASLLLGSVSRHVATHARASVAVVRTPHAAGDGPVVVGLDTVGGDSALRLAFEEAKLRGTGIVAVHAYVATQAVLASDIMPAPEYDEQRQAAYRATLTDLVARWSEKYPEIPVEIAAVVGHPVEALVARSRTAQLVVVGHRGGGIADNLLGGIAAGLLHHAEGTVVIARGGVES